MRTSEFRVMRWYPGAAATMPARTCSMLWAC
jgi:hypothetical protein